MFWIKISSCQLEIWKKYRSVYKRERRSLIVTDIYKSKFVHRNEYVMYLQVGSQSRC